MPINAQVCTQPDIANSVGVLGRYLGDPSLIHWQAVKKVFIYLQRIKDYMLTYWCTNTLEVVDYCDADYNGCVNDVSPTTRYVFVMAREAVS